MCDVNTLLTQLAARTNDAQQAWPVLWPDDDEIGEDDADAGWFFRQPLGLHLTHRGGSTRSLCWRCGYVWQRDEGAEWAFYADGNTLAATATRLIAMLDGAHDDRTRPEVVP